MTEMTDTNKKPPQICYTCEGEVVMKFRWITTNGAWPESSGWDRASIVRELKEWCRDPVSWSGRGGRHLEIRYAPDSLTVEEIADLILQDRTPPRKP